MKKLQKNYTTPEQSKRLLELGLPVKSADCYYRIINATIQFTIRTLCAMLYLIPMSPIFVMYYISLYTFKCCNWLINNCPLYDWTLALNNKLLTKTNHNNE